MAERVVWPEPDDEDDYYDPDELPERPGSRKPQKLSSLPKPARVNPRKRKVDITSLLTESEWRRLRQLVFARSGWLCVRCGQRKPLQCHHRKLTAQGGPDIAWNLIGLCAGCHQWCHRHPRQAQAGGWIVPSFADPQARAVLLHTGELAQLDDTGGYAWRERP